MCFYFILLQILLSVGHPAEMFNIERNDHGHTQRWEFSVLDQKHPFWTNLAQKIKIVPKICSKKSKLSV